jgi:glucokinase
MSRVDIARETGLSKPTVNKIVAGLLDEGMLVEVPAGGPEQRGRSGPRPKLVAFRSEFGYVVGVDVGANKLLVMLADLGGRVVATKRVAARGPRRASTVLAELRRTVQAVLGEVGVAPNLVKVACIGTPGVVDPVTQRVTLAPQIPGWDDVDIGAAVRGWLPCTVLVESEVQLSMLAERWHGPGQGVDDLVYINAGIGIAAGILLGGERHRGATGSAGEIGYLPIADHDGEPDHAPDGFGSFERAAGGAAYARLGSAAARRRGGARLRQLAGGTPDDVDAEIVFQAAQEGDPVASAIVETLLERLARGVAAVATVVDPDVVIIGGGLSRAGEPLRSCLERNVDRLLPRAPGILLSTLGEEAVALGAIAAAIAEWETSTYSMAVEEA